MVMKLSINLYIIFLSLAMGLSNNKYSYNDNGRVIIPDKNIISTLPKDGGELWNRLVFESSPYLLQHAANPVNWYPWAEEAFQAAKQLDKPVFLFDSLSLPTYFV